MFSSAPAAERIDGVLLRRACSSLQRCSIHAFIGSFREANGCLVARKGEGPLSWRPLEHLSVDAEFEFAGFWHERSSLCKGTLSGRSFPFRSR